VVDGFNVCIFAYGQTGSGKTFTMQGNNENPGINYRAIEELFSLLKPMQSFNDIKVSLMMVELYLDQFYDLLNTKNTQKLEVKEDLIGMTYISNTTVIFFSLISARFHQKH
jgi:kinesin family protein C2/C3